MKKTLCKVVFWIAILASLPEAAKSSSDKVILGQSAAFKGASSALGIELWRGADAYFRHVNEVGGVDGKKIEVRALDDSYDGDKTLTNTITLLKDPNVFALFGYVGTPTIIKALPAIQKFHSENSTFLFSNFTGAQPQREPPHSTYVFNVRSSYRDETAGLVGHFVKMGHKKIGVFIQNDSYGRSGFDGTQRALAAVNLKVFAEANYPRGAVLQDPMVEQVKVLQGADAIISVGSYHACAAFIRDMRNSGFKGPIANVSFVGSEALLKDLLDLNLASKKKGENRDYTENLVVSQVVPPWIDTSYPIVREYVKFMDKYLPELPMDLRDGGYLSSRYSFGSLEGFINAKIFVEILKKVPSGKLTRMTFLTAAESVSNLDIGLKAKISFSKTDHQAMEHVYFTTIKNDQYVEIVDWNRFK